METVTLKAAARTESGKGPARRLRAAGKVPSIAYGDDVTGEKSLSVAVDHSDLRAILLSERGRNSIIDLDIDGGQTLRVMVKDYVVHPLSRDIIHADFFTIDDSKKVVCEIPFKTKGKSKGEGSGGTLLVNLRDLKVRCPAANIPVAIEYDVSHLEIEDIVKVKDLTLPDNTEPITPGDRKVITVKPPRVVAAVADEGEGAEGEGEEGGEAAEGGEGGED